jgi:hypothetical protein
MIATTKADELAAMDARIDAYTAATNQAVVLVKTITPTRREDHGAPWAGLAADIRRLP